MVGRGGRGSPRHDPGDVQGKGCMLTLAICVSISTQISQLQVSIIERLASVLRLVLGPSPDFQMAERTCRTNQIAPGQHCSSTLRGQVLYRLIASRMVMRAIRPTTQRKDGIGPGFEKSVPSTGKRAWTIVSKDLKEDVLT